MAELRFRATPKATETRRQVHLMLPGDVYERLKQASDRDGTSVNEWICQAIMFLTEQPAK